MSIRKTLLWKVRIRRGTRLIKQLEAERRLLPGVRLLASYDGWQAFLEYTDAGAASATTLQDCLHAHGANSTETRTCEKQKG
jgi:hypothetical protein